MRCLLTILVCVTPVFAIGQENLGAKVVRVPLNQEQPSVIKLGIHGITTIEFPMKIEALDGYGFSLNPAPDGQDLFQISFNKGTNFISLKAIKPGAEGNLRKRIHGHHGFLLGVAELELHRLPRRGRCGRLEEFRE